MIGVYFSGTGNSKYCIEKFLEALDPKAMALSIEDDGIAGQIAQHQQLVLCYPVQYSNIPKILRDFITGNPGLWTGKRVFILATMGLFSGDGSGILGRLLSGYGAFVIGGLHLKMPDSISDERALKRSIEENRRLVQAAEQKLKQAAQQLMDGKPPQEGIGFLYHLAGLFGQRLYFYHKTKHYSSKLKIDANLCTGVEGVLACVQKEILS